MFLRWGRRRRRMLFRAKEKEDVAGVEEEEEEADVVGVEEEDVGEGMEKYDVRVEEEEEDVVGVE